MTSDHATRVRALRSLLRERFPSAHARPAGEIDCTESCNSAPPPSDIVFSPGEIGEIVAGRPGCGGALLIGELLERSKQGNRVLTLVDGKDSFDPDSFGPRLCQRLLWLRCHNAEQAIQATDLLLRDGNLPGILLDLQLNPLAEMQALPPSVWHRFRGLTEQSGAALLVLTSTPIVASAHRRFMLRPEGSPAGWDRPRSQRGTRDRTELLRHRPPTQKLSA